MRVLIIILFMTNTLSAGVPDFITYSGRITDGSYDGLSAQATITFRLYDVAEGGTALWEHEEAVVVQDGYFSVMLSEGTTNDQPKTITTVFAEHGETWMELEVGGQVLAREAVGSVPYAVRSEFSDKSRFVETSHSQAKYASNSVYRGSTYNNPAVASLGSFNSSGLTNGKVLFNGTIGYRAAKLACEAALGSPSAHLCSSTEMGVSAQMGATDGMVDISYWIWSGSATTFHKQTKDVKLYDCHGFTVDYQENESASFAGRVWHGGAGYPNWYWCSGVYPLACCDFAEED